MSDLKDKLEHLKREKKARSKSQRIREKWENIDNSPDLSVKEKLQKLINLTQEDKTTPSQKPSFEPVSRKPLQYFENAYSLDIRYGKIILSSGLEITGDILARFSGDPAFEELDLSTSVFIDVETTGLSGGTGVVPFLVGLGYYSEDKFYIVQYFVGDLAEEERMIKELGEFFNQMNFSSLITFNGKGFDLPLLETRFILNRQPFYLSELPHLDFLYSARSLWKHKYQSCGLSYLAQNVLKTDRWEDIPSAEVPWRYFQYLRTGNFEVIEPVLYHNQEDILSLLGVVIAGGLIFSEKEPPDTADAMDLFGAGKVMENRGDMEKSAWFYQKALNGNLDQKISLQAKKKLSLFFKRNEEWDKAVSLWKEITSRETPSREQLFSLRELAMYMEHKQKNYEEAKKVAEEGLVLSMGFSTYYEKDFSYRLQRLQKKIETFSSEG